MKGKLNVRMSGIYLSGVVFTILVIAAPLFFTSCPPPFEELLTTQAGDELPPTITIDSPQEGSTYRSAVIVSGTITDDSSVAGDYGGGVISAAYELLYVTPPVNGDIVLEEDGTFSFTCSTVNLTGEQKIKISAKDWNGNTAVKECTLVHWSDGPYITISSPEDSEYYAATVVAEGTVWNSIDETDETDEISSLNWAVQPGGLGEAVHFNSDGTFAFQFSTSGLQGSITLTVTATDKNGNISNIFRTLHDAGNDVPSFTVTPGDGSVVLDWEPVPLAESYTVYYTTNGSIPSETYGTTVNDASAGMEIPSLPNGSLSVFQLHAHSSSGSDNWSNYVKAIPLSPITLSPKVIGGEETITVTWAEIDAVDSYQVWRSQGRNEDYHNISGSISTNAFTDSIITPGTYYWYKVRPASYNDSFSQPSAGMAYPAPERYPHEKRFTYDTSGYSSNIVSSGNYLFIADETAVRCLEMKSSSATEVGNYSCGALDIHVLGDMVYAVGGRYLTEIDFGNPSSPSFSGDYYNPVTSYSGYAVYADATYQYMGGYRERLRVLDIADPSPLVWGEDDSGVGQDITVDNGYIIVSSYYGLRLYDHADPAAGHVGAATYNGAGFGVDSVWPYVYVADEEYGLRTIDCSIPTAPVEEATSPLDTPGIASDIAIDGGLLYLADDYGGVSLYDISTLASPSYIETIYTSGNAQGVYAESGSLYIADGYAGVHGYYIDRYAPATAMGPDSGDGFNAGNAVAISGGTIYTTWSSALRVYDLHMTDGTASLIDTATFTDNAQDASVSGDTLFLLSQSQIHAVDVTDHTGMTIIDSCTIDGMGWNLDSYGHYAYLACRNGGFQIARLYNDTLEVVSAINTPGYCMGVVVDFPYAYIADAENGFHIINVAVPEDPRIIGSCSTTQYAWDLCVEGDYAYVADGFDGLKIIDITDPYSPTVVGSCYVPGRSNSVLIFGNIACIAAHGNGVQLVNVSDPTAPFVIGSHPDQGTYISKFTREGNFVIVADGSTSYIVDLLDETP